MEENNEPQNVENDAPDAETDPVKETGKAKKFAGQAKDILSKVDAGKAFKSTDEYTGKFMAGVYKTLKILAAILSLACIAALVYALARYATTTTPSVRAPVFDSAAFESGAGNAGSARRKPSNEDFREIRNNFGNKIDDVIDAGSLDAKDDYNFLVEILYNLDPENRSEYIDGAVPFMKDFVSYYRKKGKEPSLEICRQALALSRTRSYHSFFEQAIEQREVLKEQAAARKAGFLSLAGSAVLFLMMLVIMTLLIQIEENTRKQR